mgnify:CR=1 FL=1|jgi:hypothetical protein
MIPMLPILLGAAVGGLTSKKPLKGALLGAAGGALTGGMGGLLSNAGTAASLGTGLGTQQTAMLAAQEAGMGGGLLSSLKDAAPAMNAAATGIQTAQSLMPQQQPVQSAGLPQSQPFDASGLLSANNQQLQALQQKRMNRRGMA